MWTELFVELMSGSHLFYLDPNNSLHEKHQSLRVSQEEIPPVIGANVPEIDDVSRMWLMRQGFIFSISAFIQFLIQLSRRVTVYMYEESPV